MLTVSARELGFLRPSLMLRSSASPDRHMRMFRVSVDGTQLHYSAQQALRRSVLAISIGTVKLPSFQTASPGGIGT